MTTRRALSPARWSALWLGCLALSVALVGCDDDGGDPDATSNDTIVGVDDRTDTTVPDDDTGTDEDTSVTPNDTTDTSTQDTADEDTADEDTTQPSDTADTAVADTTVEQDTTDTATPEDTTPPEDTMMPPEDMMMPGDRETAAGMCARWTADRMFTAEGSWSGDVASCTVGTLDQTGTDNTLRQINLFRWLARLPPTANDVTKAQQAQACSLMMDANDALDHSPPMNWDCYSADGATGAGRSNISPTPAVAAIDLYMIDPGNSTTLGHRRWLLSSGLDDVGIGSTTSHSCLNVVGPTGGGPDWTAWPPPGPFPLAANFLTGFWTMDETGWSIQSDSIDLSNASVAITDSSGANLAVTVTSLASGYGSSSAISIVPDGWTMEVETYTVSVTGVSQPFSYDVEVVDCN